MKQKYYLKIIAMAIIFLSLSANSQSQDKVWTSVDLAKAKNSEQYLRKIDVVKEKFYQLDIERIKHSLINVGRRENSRNTILYLPNSDGKLKRYNVFEAPVMESELQAKYPNIRTYTGQGVDNPTEIVKLSITPKGLHAMFLGTSEGTQFIDPYSTEGDIHTVYSRRDVLARDFEFECGVIDDPLLSNKTFEEDLAARNADDGILRDYRIAIACTGEYATFHGGTVGGAMAAMATTMNRVNGIYERDLSITMSMVDNTSIIFTDGATDPFDNNDANVLIGQSQSVINSNIGAANYDIGHTFSTGGGGLAGVGVTCNNNNKARGITGSPQPAGDLFDVDFVAHELGHQFGSPHTFNGNQGNCSGGNRSSSDAYEPGSGTTIMAYAGICGSDNVQSSSDDYFHQRSLVRIWTHVSSTGFVCPANRTNTGNIEPTAEAGPNYIIPQGTPYKLDGSASSDPDGNVTLTYTWEQYDLGPSGVPTETTASGPLVRSFGGTEDPIRYVPRLEDLKNSGGSTTWEKLATVNRDINYRLTVRDNDTRGGQTDFDTMTATVTTSSGPFIVTSQSTDGQSWDVGTTQTITWNVAGTTGNGINESNVNILFSTDGLVYDTVLASNVANDGSHDITVPNVSTANGRVMVEAVNNTFFNINTEDILIGATISCTEYSTGAISVAIPDGPGPNQQGTPVGVPLTITDNAIINGNIKISVDVTHTYIGDLLIQLQSPGGAEFTNIWQRDCDSGAFANIDVTFEDGQPAIACASPTTGTFAPTFPLSTFDGVDINGTWNLVFVDFYDGDTGTVNGWSLEICETNLSVDENELDNLTIYPNPNNGEFNIGFNPKSGEDIGIEVYDISGRIIFSKTFDTVSRFEEVIRLNNAQSGVYLLNISDGSQKVTKKIVVD